MKKAGYSNGKYNGPPLLTIADNESPAKETAEAFQEQVKKIGLKLQFREVPHATMLSKFCQVPKAKVAICPNLGWGADFFAAQSFIDPLFNGKNIVPSGNVNTAQVERPEAQRADRQGQADHRPDRGGARPGATSTRRSPSQAYFIPWLWDNNVGLAVDEHEGRQQQVQLGRLGLRVQLAEVGGATRQALKHQRPRRARAGASVICEPRGGLGKPWSATSSAACCGCRAAGRWSASSPSSIFYLLPDGRPRAAARRPPAEPASWSSRSATTSGSTSPWYQQYFDYMKRLVLHFDFGYSYQNNISRQAADLRPPARHDLAWRSARPSIWLVVGHRGRDHLRGRAAARCSTASTMGAVAGRDLGAGLLARARRALPVRGRHRQVPGPFFKGAGSYVPFSQDPCDLVPVAAPAVVRAGGVVRRALRAAAAREPDRGDVRGLHPHGARQGAAASGASSCATACAARSRRSSRPPASTSASCSAARS